MPMNISGDRRATGAGADAVQYGEITCGARARQRGRDRAGQTDNRNRTAEEIRASSPDRRRSCRLAVQHKACSASPEGNDPDEVTWPPSTPAPPTSARRRAARSSSTDPLTWSRRATPAAAGFLPSRPSVDGADRQGRVGDEKATRPGLCSSSASRTSRTSERVRQFGRPTLLGAKHRSRKEPGGRALRRGGFALIALALGATACLRPRRRQARAPVPTARRQQLDPCLVTTGRWARTLKEVSAEVERRSGDGTLRLPLFALSGLPQSASSSSVRRWAAGGEAILESLGPRPGLRRPRQGRRRRVVQLLPGLLGRSATTRQ
jgi:hypothetical protein